MHGSSSLPKLVGKGGKANKNIVAAASMKEAGGVGGCKGGGRLSSGEALAPLTIKGLTLQGIANSSSGNSNNNRYSNDNKILPNAKNSAVSGPQNHSNSNYKSNNNAKAQSSSSGKSNKAVLNDNIKSANSNSKGARNIAKKEAAAAQSESVAARAQRLLAEAAKSNEVCGKVHVKFNHYNKSFPIHNGVLKWKDVDDEYCFSFVYKGNYSRDISLIPDGLRNPFKATVDDLIAVEKDEGGEYFLGLATNGAYVVNVVEDAKAGVGIEGLTLREGPLLLSGGDGAVKSGNLQMDLLTKELKSLDPKLLQSAEAKDLIEKRDLEDILFSKS